MRAAPTFLDRVETCRSACWRPPDKASLGVSFTMLLAIMLDDGSCWRRTAHTVRIG